METSQQGQQGAASSWVPLGYSFGFLFKHPQLIGWSLLLVVLTGALTWGGYLLTVDWTQHLTGSFFTTPPATEKWWQWPIMWGWVGLKWTYMLLTRVVAFYLAFSAAYSLTTPGYVYLSNWAGNSYSPEAGKGEAQLSARGALLDLWEGIKIGVFGILIAVLALLLNFLPVVGQAAVFCLYAFYSTLMFIDYPSSRYRWSLGRKIRWLRFHSAQSFRLGVFPALISMVPVLNIFFMALFFPLFTVHSTLNFLTIEGRGK